MPLPVLLIVDGPGGPAPEWYLPRLRSSYDVHVLLRPSGNPAADDRRRRLVDANGHSVSAPDGADLIAFTAEYAASQAAAGIASFSEIPVIEAHGTAALLGLPGNPPSALVLQPDFCDRLGLVGWPWVAGPAWRGVAGPDMRGPPVILAGL